MFSYSVCTLIFQSVIRIQVIRIEKNFSKTLLFNCSLNSVKQYQIILIFINLFWIIKNYVQLTVSPYIIYRYKYHYVLLCFFIFTLGHPLSSEYGSNIIQNERKCKVCNSGNIDDEIQVMFFALHIKM